jgi:hypothetical protein
MTWLTDRCGAPSRLCNGTACGATRDLPPGTRSAFHLQTAPKAALPLLGWLYRHMFSVVLQTHKPYCY